VTTVVGVVRRPKLGYSSFADITAVPVAQGGIAKDGITFAGDLTAEEYAAVWARLDSTDDADLVRRADLRAKRDAVVGDEPEKVALRASIDYMLGD
jgi:hypothetical protein